MLMPRIFDESLFDEFFDFPDFDKLQNRMEKKLYGNRASNLMKCDVKDLNDSYELVVDLPGFTKDEITADIQNGYLIIAAAKGLDRDEQEADTGRYIRRERYAGACRRSFYIGDNIRKEDIRAKFEHGILSLLIPKRPVLPADDQQRILIE